MKSYVNAALSTGHRPGHPKLYSPLGTSRHSPGAPRGRALCTSATPLLVRVPFYFSNVLESLRAATQKIFRLLLQLYHTTVYVVDQEPYRLLTLG